MDHADHVALIRAGIPSSRAAPGKVWADFGSGNGAFTLALADLLGPDGEIYSVDKKAASLRRQKRAIRARFPDVLVHYLNTDFTRKLDIPPLAGAVMANSLHFQRDKDPVLKLVRSYLQPGGRLILVEYNRDRGNTWVPYPLSFATWRQLARRNGFTDTRVLAKRPSRFMGEIYAALSLLGSENRSIPPKGQLP